LEKQDFQDEMFDENDCGKYLLLILYRKNMCQIIRFLKEYK